jgi:hypothetical protein
MSKTNHLGHASRPNELLAAYMQRYPNAHRDIDEMRMEMRGVSAPDWPDWCYAPIACSQAAIANHHGVCVTHLGESSPLALMDATAFAALAAWRKTRGVYTFDPTIYQEVCATPLDGQLPCDLLLRMPDEFAIKQAIATATKAVVNLVLFLCSQASDISGRQGRPGNPTPTKTRNGIKVFAAEQTREWLVGVRMGSALRKAHSLREGPAVFAERNGPRPHIRRAHWHTYRVGPRTCGGQRIPSTEQQTQLRWLHPTLVRVCDEDTLTTVVYPIT